MDKYELLQVEATTDRLAYHAIRRSVLFEANGFFNYNPDGPEESKAENLSLLLKHEGIPIGTTRLDTNPNGTAIIRLVAIASNFQRQGHGSALMNRVESLAQSISIETLYVYAILNAVEFYERQGYCRFNFDKDSKQRGVQLRKLLKIKCT